MILTDQAIHEWLNEDPYMAYMRACLRETQTALAEAEKARDETVQIAKAMVYIATRPRRTAGHRLSIWLAQPRRDWRRNHVECMRLTA